MMCSSQLSFTVSISTSMWKASIYKLLNMEYLKSSLFETCLQFYSHVELPSREINRDIKNGIYEQKALKSCSCFK